MKGTILLQLCVVLGIGCIPAKGEVVRSYLLIPVSGGLYEAQEIPIPLKGDRNSIPIAINNKSQIIGITSARIRPSYNSPENSHMYLYENGESKYLGNGFPCSINNLGQVVGHDWPNSFIYENGQKTLLDLGFENLFVTGINNNGTIIGYSDGQGVLPWGCFYYKNGVRKDINVGQKGYLRAINDNELAVGQMGVAAFGYQNDNVEYIIADSGTAYDINNNNQVVGQVAVNGKAQPFLWQNGLLFGLGTMGYANAVNEQGVIVGHFFTIEGDSHAFVYKDDRVLDLNDLISNKTKFLSIYDKWNLAGAVDINDNGLIIAYATIPEPGPLVLLVPNGGEIYLVGTTKTITWESEDETVNVQLDYSSDNGATWNYMKTVANTGSATWTIPNVPSLECLIKITDADNPDEFDISVSVFTILLQYGGGTGTREDPYQIWTPEQMNSIGTNPDDWDNQFKLMADIDFSNFTGTNSPVGLYYGEGHPGNLPFTGVFDGNGKAISNYSYSDDQAQECVGVFGYLGGNGQIKKLILNSVKIHAPNSTSAGGLVGYNQGGRISDCFVMGSITAKDNVGGIVGFNREGMLENCGSQCTVSGSAAIGGAAGCNHSGLVRRCYFRGQVKGENTAGGVVGSNEEEGTVRQSFSMGSVQGNFFIGGLAGSNYGSTIDNSYSVADASGNSVIGGLVGSNTYGSDILNCYSAGRVYGVQSVGGLLGFTNNAKTTASFWDIQISGQLESAGGEGKTTSEMRMDITFRDAGWFFDPNEMEQKKPIWQIREGRWNPRLIWQQESEDDITGDFGVNLEEFSLLSIWWGEDACGEANAFCDGMDLDQSGSIDLIDFCRFVDNWMELKSASCFGLSCFATCPSMDVTGDCYVDLEDFADLSGQWLDESMYTDLIRLASQWLTGDNGIDKVFIPGGVFQMGDSTGDGYAAELPVHTVALHPFYLGQYEVTNQQYCDYLNSALDRGLIAVISNVVYQADSGTSYPYCDTYASSIYSQIDYSGGVFSVRAKSGRKMGNDPMVRVSWYGAVAYCNWRSQVEEKPVCYNLSTWAYDPGKKGYHLPTEAQWEYAARGGVSGRRFPGGDTISHSLANYYSSWVEGHPYYFYDENSYSGFHLTWNDEIFPYTSPVGSFAANGYGLYDMDGNISEWCNDWYSDTYYNESPETNPAGPATGSYRVLRGGSWYFLPIDCRAASRSGGNPGTRGGNGFVGFRVSLEL